MLDLQSIETCANELSAKYLRPTEAEQNALKAVFSARRNREKIVKILLSAYEASANHIAEVTVYPGESFYAGPYVEGGCIPSGFLTDSDVHELYNLGITDPWEVINDDWHDFKHIMFNRKIFLQNLKWRRFDYGEDGYINRVVSPFELDNGLFCVSYGTFYNEINVRSVQFKPFPQVPFPALAKHFFPGINFEKGTIAVPTPNWVQDWVPSWASRWVSSFWEPDIGKVQEKDLAHLKSTLDKIGDPLPYMLTRHFTGEVDGLIQRLEDVFNLRGQIRGTFQDEHEIDSRERTLAGLHLAPIFQDSVDVIAFRARAKIFAISMGNRMQDLRGSLNDLAAEKIRVEQQLTLDAQLRHEQALPVLVNDAPIRACLGQFEKTVLDFGDLMGAVKG